MAEVSSPTPNNQRNYYQGVGLEKPSAQAVPPVTVTPHAAKRPHISKYLIALVALVGILIALSGAVWFFGASGTSLGTFGTFGNSNVNPFNIYATQEAAASTPRGFLVMAVAAVSPDLLTARIFPAGYYFSEQALLYVPVDALAESPEGENLTYQHLFSGNGNYVTFVGAADIEDAQFISDISLQVYRADISGSATFEETTSRIQNAERVTEGAGVVRQAPSISDRGDVLYMAHELEAPQTLFTSPANEWEVHLVTAEGEERVVTTGIQPKWIENDYFVFLKNDGLYLYSLADESETKLQDAQGTATARMSLDVSNDYSLLAWSVSGEGEIRVFRTFDWENGGFSLLGTIPVPGMAAVFSPDGRFLAVKTLQPGEVPNEVRVALEYYNAETLFRAAPTVYLIGADPNQTYLTDWRL